MRGRGGRGRGEGARRGAPGLPGFAGATLGCRAGLSAIGGGADAILGCLSLGVSLGTLSRCGHYQMHLPLGIPCVTVKGSVREGLSLWGSCHVGPSSFSVILGSLCHGRGSSCHGGVLMSRWGLVSLGFSVGPCPVAELA